MNETVSVIVPIYKVEKYLGECIRSLIQQTYRNLEIILVDDGSPDSCGEMCDQFAKLDSRIKVIHKENGGLSDARNVGICAATGDYIGFVDSDDYVDSRFYEYLLSLVKKYDADIAECYSIMFRDGEEPSGTIIDGTKVFMPREWITETNLGQFLSCVAWNKIYKRELFNGITYPLGVHYEDEATTYRVVYKATRIVRGESRLYFYRQRENSITGIERNILETQQKFVALYGRCQFFEAHGESELEAFSYSKLMIFMLSDASTWNRQSFYDRDKWKSIIKRNVTKVLYAKVVPLRYKLYIMVKFLKI